MFLLQSVNTVPTSDSDPPRKQWKSQRFLSSNPFWFFTYKVFFSNRDHISHTVTNSFHVPETAEDLKMLNNRGNSRPRVNNKLNRKAGAHIVFCIAILVTLSTIHKENPQSAVALSSYQQFCGQKYSIFFDLAWFLRTKSTSEGAPPRNMFSTQFES